CGTQRCPCYRASLECDPQLCVSCKARHQHSNQCRNVQIQRGNSKVFDINITYWADAHAGTSYVFELNQDVCIDSRNFGNVSRYINHSENPNCYAKVNSVHGDHRIGIFSFRRIFQHEELFLHYGNRFF
ncbi:hypothetical protein HYPSUDRAFT_103099, partial [Hypholoma sublateritium FD-334 SS-4]